MIPTLYTPLEAARKLNVKRSAIYALIRQDKLKVLRITDHNIRIEEDEIVRYVNMLRNEPTIRNIAADLVHHDKKRQAR